MNLLVLKSRRLLQFGAAFAASMVFMVAGLSIGWTAPMLPKLLMENSHIAMTSDEGSWMVALLSVGCTAGVLPLPYVTSVLGRRTVLILIMIPYITGWLTIMFAQTVEVLYVARVLLGVSVITTFVVVPMYLTEISEIEIRGILSSLPQLFYNIGAILEFCIVPYISYALVSIISIIFPITCFIALLTVPESPYYLLYKGKENEAEESLMKLRGQADKQCVQEELISMKAAVSESHKLGNAPIQDLFLIRGNRRALILVLSLILMQQFCGQLAVISYTTQIFEQASGMLDANISVIILGCIQAVTSGVLSTLVDRIGRRPLILTSASGLAVACFLMATYFCLVDRLSYNHLPIGWLPITCLILYMSSFSLGLGVLPLTIMGEVFPTNVKGLAASAVLFVHSVSGVVVTKLFQIMTDEIGPDSPFWFFFAFCFVDSIFIAWYLPETMGKPFSEIYKELNVESYPRRRNKDNSKELNNVQIESK